MTDERTKLCAILTEEIEKYKDCAKSKILKQILEEAEDDEIALLDLLEDARNGGRFIYFSQSEDFLEKNNIGAEDLSELLAEIFEEFPDDLNYIIDIKNDPLGASLASRNKILNYIYAYYLDKYLDLVEQEEA